MKLVEFLILSVSVSFLLFRLLVVKSTVVSFVVVEFCFVLLFRQMFL